MDKIEFFLYIAEPSGVLGAASGARVGGDWEGGGAAAIAAAEDRDNG